MSEKLVRIYPGSDMSLVKQAVKTESYFPAYMGAFQSRYQVVFPPESFIEFSAQLKKLLGIPSDSALLGHQAAQTAAIIAIIVRFGPYHRDVCMAAEGAFFQEPAVQAEFGVRAKTDIISSADHLHAYLLDFAMLWLKHSAALIAHGCPADMGDVLASLEQELARQINLQQIAMDERHSAWVARVSTGNSLWKQLLKFERYAPSVFGPDSAEAEIFHLDRGSRGPGENDEEPKPAA